MNFKKQISIILIFSLLVSNLGFALSVHYCDDEIASISINTISNFQEIEKDCCGKVERESKCCKNKIIKSNDKSDQITVKIVSIDTNYNHKYNDWDFLVFNKKFNFKQREITTYYCDSNSPPLYLLYSHYNFYD